MSGAGAKHAVLPGAPGWNSWRASGPRAANSAPPLLWAPETNAGWLLTALSSLIAAVE